MDPSGTLSPPRRRSWPRTVLIGIAGLAAAVITAAFIYGLLVLVVMGALVLIMNGFGSNK
ncbi:hypothetical protein [Actinoallomurus iriomotensis]|uniref:hypothetical protein n=1 Tax=Actinoallomurus TaxID=667113 RepID=UPI0025578F04|nr:hypothetical protein [Actinoallomurus iriomotensis]